LRRQRRSKEVRNYGHPTEDAFLLFSSAVILAAAMLSAIRWLGPGVLDRRSPGRYLFAFMFLGFGAGITYFANQILRVGRKKK
jgi:hypothetical protein